MDFNLLALICLDHEVDFDFYRAEFLLGPVSYGIRFHNYKRDRHYNVQEMDMERLMNHIEQGIEYILHDLIISTERR